MWQSSIFITISAHEISEAKSISPDAFIELIIPQLKIQIDILVAETPTVASKKIEFDQENCSFEFATFDDFRGLDFLRKNRNAKAEINGAPYL